MRARVLWRCSRGALATAAATLLPLHVSCTPRRWQSSSTFSGGGGSISNGDDDDAAALQSELAFALAAEGVADATATTSSSSSVGGGGAAAMSTTPLPSSSSSSSSSDYDKTRMSSPTSRVQLRKVDRPPGRFDLLTNSLVYSWQTTAALARKVTGPMREWATELKYRTGVHIEAEPTYPERLLYSTYALGSNNSNNNGNDRSSSSSSGGYACADDVDITVYLFGSERGIFNCHKLMEAAVAQDPSYVRLGVFRRVPGGGGGGAAGDVEWLLLRRINRELRPPDIPPISLKLPGKWTLMYEQFKEAAMRTLWEETGISVDAAHVYPTARLTQTLPAFYWRVPVYYFVAEVPYDVRVLGPQVARNSYMHHWDARLLRQSPDPIDRAWAQLADVETGCAWLRAPMIDELQRPLRGADYMAIRYTPPPYANLTSVLGFDDVATATTTTISSDGATSSGDSSNDVATTSARAEGDGGATADKHDRRNEKTTADADKTA